MLKLAVDNHPNVKGRHQWVRSLSLAIALFGITVTSIAELSSKPTLIAQDYLIDEQLVEHGTVTSHVRIYGSNDNEKGSVIILPSLGRGVEDYTEEYGATLTTQLAASGFTVLLIQPRGIGRSRGDLSPEGITMKMLADDIKASMDALSVETVHLIGHAFGNRLARSFSTLYPERVDDLVLLAAGGDFPLNAEQRACLGQSFDLRLDASIRLAAIDCAFFAKGNDPRIWLEGWYPKLAAAQIAAVATVKPEFFKEAGGKPMLLVQPSEDFIAPPALAGRPLKEQLGDQVTYVEVSNAGHALVAEQPTLVGELVIEYFQRHSKTAKDASN